MALNFRNNISTGNFAPSVNYGTTIRQPVSMEINTPDVNSNFNIDLSNVANAIADRTEAEGRLKLAELDNQLKLAAFKEKDNENKLKELQRIEGLNYGKEVEGLQLALKQGMPLTEYQVNLKAINDKYRARGIIEPSTMNTLGNSYGSIGKALLEKEATYEQERSNKSKEAKIAIVAANNPGFAALSPSEQNALIDTVEYYLDDYKSNEQRMSSVAFTDEGRKRIEERQKSNVVGIVGSTYNQALNNLIATKGVGGITQSDVYDLRYKISSQILQAIPSMDKTTLTAVLNAVENESIPQMFIQQRWKADKDTYDVLSTAKDTADLKRKMWLNNVAPQLGILDVMSSPMQEAYYQNESNRLFVSGSVNAIVGGINVNPGIEVGKTLYDRSTNTSYTIKEEDSSTEDIGYHWAMQNLAKKTVENKNNPNYTPKARVEDYTNLINGLIYNPKGFNEEDVATSMDNLQSDVLTPEEIKDNLARKGNGAVLMHRQIGNQGVVNQLVRNANKLKEEYRNRIRIRKDGTITFLDGKGFLEELSDTAEGIEVMKMTNEINDTLTKISKDPYARAGAATYLFNMELTPLKNGEEDYLAQMKPADWAAYGIIKTFSTITKSALALDAATSPTLNVEKEEARPRMSEGTIAFQKTPEQMGVDLQSIAENNGYNGTIDLNTRNGGVYNTKNNTFTPFESATTKLEDGKVMLYPRVDNDTGAILTKSDALKKAMNGDDNPQWYKRKGAQHLGIYSNEEEANKVSKMLDEEFKKVFKPATAELKASTQAPAYVAKRSEPYKDAKGILTIPISDDNTQEIRNYNGDDYSNITDVNNLYIDTIGDKFIILERGDSQHDYGTYQTMEDAELALAITKEQASMNE